MKMSEISRKYVGVPYKVGGNSVEEGFDCIRLCLAVGRDLGHVLPESPRIGEYDLSNYTALFAPGMPFEIQKKSMVGFFEAYFDEIEFGQAFVGDIALLEAREMITAGTIVGNGNVMVTLIDRGVTIIALDKFRIKRWRFFRWRPVRNNKSITGGEI